MRGDYILIFMLGFFLGALAVDLTTKYNCDQYKEELKEIEILKKERIEILKEINFIIKQNNK